MLKEIEVIATAINVASRDNRRPNLEKLTGLRKLVEEAAATRPQ